MVSKIMTGIIYHRCRGICNINRRGGIFRQEKIRVSEVKNQGFLD